MTDTQSPQSIELLTFQLADQEYSLDIMSVREIRGWTRATPLPHAPKFMKGVINLRGTVLPVMDLAQRLGLAAREQNDRNVIIVVKHEETMTGLLVDAVSDILTSDHVEFHATPEVASGTAKQFVKGVLANAERMIRLLDVATIMPGDMAEAS